MSTQELWKPVPGWLYEVSNLGFVRREGRKATTGSINRAVGYYYCVLCRPGEQKRVLVHALIMQVFVGERPHKAVINHINGVKTDNRVENLEYTTQRHNMREAVRMGLQPIGERHPNAKLREVDVEAIRACARAGLPDGKIADLFQVRSETVGKIVRGERWA